MSITAIRSSTRATEGEIRTGQRIRDQPFSRGNRALAFSKQNGLPVRVIRGFGHDSPYSPNSGYSYDGLYAVEDYWHEVGKSGFEVWRFRLVKIPQMTVPGQIIAEKSADYSVPDRRNVRVSRMIRDTAQARAVKALYKSRCQMCGTRLQCPAGPYAEAAHIRPLGAPHNGPDTRNNPLPVSESSRVIRQRCHLDRRGFVFDRHGSHHIDQRHLAYHRDHLLVAGVWRIR